MVMEGMRAKMRKMKKGRVSESDTKAEKKVEARGSVTFVFIYLPTK